MGSWVALGVAMVKVIALVAVFFGVSMMNGKSSAAWGFEEKALLIFFKIEEIAHKRDNILHKIGVDHFAIWEANFHTMEESFHKEESLIGRFKIAQKLDSLIHRQDGFTQLKWYISDAEEKEFQRLEQSFDELYNHVKTISWIKKTGIFKQKSLEVFKKLFDVAKQRDDIIHLLGKDNFLAWEVSYHNAVAQFDTAETIEDKYEITKIISNLLYRQDEYFNQKWYVWPQQYITDEQEALYQQIQNDFEKIN